jgi:RNA polymerase sigma-70 factor, ECF subfamily
MAENPGADAPQMTSEELDAVSIQLMRRIKTGDDEAFRQLVLMHQNAVIGTAAKMLNSTDDAHDIAQVVFIRIWKAAPRYEPTAKFTTWMYTILRNLVFNETRRRTRKPTTSLDHSFFDDDDGAQRDVHDLNARLPDQAALQTELEEQIDAAIMKLPKNQRMAVICRRYDDMPYEDIAEIIGTSVPSVKSLLFRARTSLRLLLKGYLTGVEDEPEEAEEPAAPPLAKKVARA